MIYKDIIQGSPEWHLLRNITASHIVDILPGKRGYKEARKKYMLELARKTLTGKWVIKKTSKAMDEGTLKEPLARSAYELETGDIVEEVGFITHPTIEGLGASPDGIISSKKKGIEIKCPEPPAHFEIVVFGKSAIKKEYIIQMNTNMMCYDCDTWDYVDYDPELKDGQDLIIIKVKKDPVLCAEIKMEVEKFKGELSDMLTKLKNL